MLWLDRVKNNIFPLSQEKRDIKKALDEWDYHGVTNDLEKPIGHCELCDHPRIRLQFLITNQYNANELWIGSECINRYDIDVYENGRKLSKREAKEKVSRDRGRLIAESKKRRVYDLLAELYLIDTSFKVESFIDDYEKNEYFTPNQAATIIWRLKKHHLSFQPQDFKVSLKKDKYKGQLIQMQQWQLNNVLPCLTPSQKEIYEREVKMHQYYQKRRIERGLYPKS